MQEKDSSTKAEVARYLLQNDSYSGLRAQKLASDNTWRFFAYDLQGNTRLLLNSDGSSNLSLLFRAFGQKQASSGSGSTLMQFGAFWGYEWDADSRMWVKARHLSGTQGRWLSQDPIGFGGGDWNLWRFVGNNPLADVDPLGLVGSACIDWHWGHWFPPPTPGTCGPDLTASLRHAVVATRVKFSALSIQQRKNACKALTDFSGWMSGNATILFAWDIEDLFHNADKWNQPPYNTGGGPCGTGDCAFTVAVDGKCFDARELNFVIFGVMWQLCRSRGGFLNSVGYSRSQLDGLIRGYKGPQVASIGAAGVQDALRWGRAGFDGWPSVASPPSNHKKHCSATCPVPLRKQDQTLTVHWETIGEFAGAIK